MRAKSHDQRMPSRWGDRFLARPLMFRRTLAAAIIVLLVAIALLYAAAERADFARAAELVRTQEQQVGVLVEVDYRGRSGTYYVIDVNGHDRTLSYGEFITDKTPGAAVRFVVDPDDDSRPIAVGSPEDWQEEPADIGTTAFAVALALVVGGIIALRIIPEDFGAKLGGTVRMGRKRRIQRG